MQEIYKAHIISLTGLRNECESFLPSPISNLDPMSQLREQTQLMANSSKMITEELSRISRGDLFNALQCWFSDVNLLECYKNLLFASQKLIFSSNTTIFRSSVKPNFITCVLNLYAHLVQFRRYLGDTFASLGLLIRSFECQFFSSYNNANRDILRLDQVRDLLSHSFDIVSAPLIDINKVAKRDFFRLSVRKFNFDHKLVEIFQFSNGEMAIFKVNSGESVSVFNSPEKLLSQLLRGNHKLLDLGRTLLFPSLRKYDLEISNISSPSTVHLKTCTGNNVSMTVQCVDPLQWEAHWKQAFKKSFDKNDLISPVLRSTSSVSMSKSSHAYQNFKLKLSKLEDLRPLSGEGLPIMLPSPTSPTRVNNIPTQVEERSRRNQTGLHRSEPLQRPLSTLMSLEQEESHNESSPNSPCITSPTLQDIESLSCDKLIELDRAIEMNISAVSTPDPVIQRYKSVSQEPSLEKISVSSEQDVEESDIESFVSGGPGHDKGVFDESSTFNPTADIYKPTLYSRKSSSLLSLFSSKSKREKSVSVSPEKPDDQVQKSSNPSSIASFHEVDLEHHQTEDQSELLPSYIDLDNGDIIFENNQVRLSFWNGKHWTKVGEAPLELCVVVLEDGSTVMVGHASPDNRYCKFAAKVSVDWKCMKSTAQDIQITIPNGDFIASVIPAKSSTLTVRCLQTERLMNILQHCVKGNLPAVIPKSCTARTLSSMPSSCISNPLTRSSTAMSGLTNSKSETINTFLLLSALKVKIHSVVEGKGWNVQNIGSVDIHAQELRNTTIAIKFDFISADRKLTSLVSQMHEIQRIGRTGLLLTLKDNEKLLEFQNKLIADQVYRLIKS